MKKLLLIFLGCTSALLAQDEAAKETKYNTPFIENLKKFPLMDRFGGGPVTVLDDGSLAFPGGQGRQDFLYAVSPTKGIYRLSMAMVRTEKLSPMRNVFQGILIRKDGIYRAGGISSFNKLKNKLDSIPDDDIPTRLALADSGWINKNRYPWAFFKKPLPPPPDSPEASDAFFNKLIQKIPVSYKYRMPANINEYGDIIQNDGRGTLEFRYAVSPNQAVFKLSPESAADLNIPSQNAYKGFIFKKKGIYATGYLYDYIYPKSQESNETFMNAYGDMLNAEDNINWKKPSREPWFFYHRDPKTNSKQDNAFISQLRGKTLIDSFNQSPVKLLDDGSIFFESLEAQVHFRYALSSKRAVYQISPEYAQKRNFNSTNVYFGVVIRNNKLHTCRSLVTFEPPEEGSDPETMRLFDERRKSIYNINWDDPVEVPWVLIDK